MSNSQDKPKTNGSEIDPMQRLASFKPPRDLLLGGAKPSKKVFTPNLNVSRNKNKGSATANSKDHRKDDKGKRDRKNDRNKNHKNGPNIIKSSGVFSEGLGRVERQSSRSSYGRDVADSPVLQKPTIRVKDFIKIDKELEDQKIRTAVGDIANGDEDVVEDFKNSKDVDAPIKLPMDDGCYSYSKPGPTVTVKEEITVKLEPEDLNLSNLAVETKHEVMDVFENTDLVRLLRSDQETMIMLQLPDTLPGRGGSTDDDPRRDRSDTGDDKPVDNRCRLSNLEEGKIGKLRIHRSGKISLLLGDTVFEVFEGTKSSFHQEAVSVAADEASRSARLVSLGPVPRKLNVVPHWESVLADLPA